MKRTWNKNHGMLAAILAAAFTVVLVFAGCEQPSDGDGVTTPEVEAAAFRANNAVAAVLGFDPETVTAYDKTVVKSALASYEKLSAEAKALLAEEKSKLDALKAAIPPLWTDVSVPGAGYQGAYTKYLKDIAYGGPAGKEKYVVVGDTYPEMGSSAIEYSVNGKDWTPVSRSVPDSNGEVIQFDENFVLSGIAYGNGKIRRYQQPEYSILR
jgi:hypothetical protein